MACLECVRACSESFYKEFDPDKSCIQIVEKKSVRPLACPQCGKCAEACEAGAIKQNAKGVYMVNKKLCTGCGKCVEACPVRTDGKGGKLPHRFQVHRLRHLRESLPDGCAGGCRVIKTAGEGFLIPQIQGCFGKPGHPFF